MRVLVVDDDPILREIAKEYLIGVGLEVELEVDGARALQSVAANHFSLIITDLVMPNVDGLELIATLCREAPETPIIAISSGVGGKNAELMLRAALALGARTALAKPLVRETFLAAVASALTGGRV